MRWRKQPLYAASKARMCRRGDWSFGRTGMVDKAGSQRGSMRIMRRTLFSMMQRARPFGFGFQYEEPNPRDESRVRIFPLHIGWKGSTLSGYAVTAVLERLVFFRWFVVHPRFGLASAGGKESRAS